MEHQYSDMVMEHFKNPRNVGEIKDPSGVGKVGNPVCVIPRTLVCKNSSIQKISGVETGIRVLSHDGLYHNVEKVYRRYYRGQILDIDVHNLGNVVTTPDHHILALKTNDLSHKHRDFRKRGKDWYMGIELKKGDTLLLPIPKEVADRKYMSFDIEKPKLDFKSKELPKRIKVDQKFLRLVGYYLAEGSVVTKPCKGQLIFTFGRHEREYIKDVVGIMQAVFGFQVNTKRELHNSINLIYHSARLARFFEKHFGKGAKNKQLPHWVLTLPQNKQKALLCGLWRGDGYVNEKGAKFVTISKVLAHQLKTLLMRQKIIFSFLTIPEKGIHKESYCIYVKSRESKLKLASIVGKRIKVPARRAKTQKAWYDGNYFYTTVDSVNKNFYQGVVYNLGVEESHSYVTEAATLHNCGDIMNLYIKVENDVIVDAKFKTYGCGAAISTSSMVTELVKGKTVKEALSISNRAVAEALGGLPPIKMHCSVLAEEALKGAIDDYMKKSGKTG